MLYTTIHDKWLIKIIFAQFNLRMRTTINLFIVLWTRRSLRWAAREINPFGDQSVYICQNYPSPFNTVPLDHRWRLRVTDLEVDRVPIYGPDKVIFFFFDCVSRRRAPEYNDPLCSTATSQNLYSSLFKWQKNYVRRNFDSVNWTSFTFP